MSRTLLWPWLTAGLVVLGSGCQNVDSRPPRNSVSAPPSREPENQELPGGSTPTSYRVRPAIPATNLPVVVVPTLQPIPVVKLPEKAIASANWQPPVPEKPKLQTPPQLEPPVPACRRAPTVRTAQQPGHAADYAWLVGCLQHDDKRNRWRVQYAGIDEQDRYGGSLELVNPGPMSGYQNGQMVRVEGDLVDPAPLEITPAYRVLAIQAVQR
jgi:hypothetical protein